MLLYFGLGFIVGVILVALALAWEIGKDKRRLVWMDENYQLHPVKKPRKERRGR